jgi:hypothetical protein
MLQNHAFISSNTKNLTYTRGVADPSARVWPLSYSFISLQGLQNLSPELRSTLSNLSDTLSNNLPSMVKGVNKAVGQCEPVSATTTTTAAAATAVEGVHGPNSENTAAAYEQIKHYLNAHHAGWEHQANEVPQRTRDAATGEIHWTCTSKCTAAGTAVPVAAVADIQPSSILDR